jgi:two-component system OmpR family sensor kinase
MTLRTRLLAGLGLVVVVLIAVSAVITATTRAQLIDQVDDRLRRFSPSEREPDRLPPLDRSGDRPEPTDGFRERVSDVYEGYVDADGRLVTRFVPNVGDGDYTAPALDPDDLPVEGATILTVDSIDGDVTYRVNAVRIGGLVAVTGVPLDDVEATIGRLILVEVLGSLAILTALGTMAWWVVHLGIRPIKEMTETATRISNGELDERIPETAPGTEPGDLAIALNRMLGHINAALDERAASEARLRRFVADASHELRTPVTTIRGYAELYRHGGLADQSALDDAMRRTEQEATRMGRLVDDMLTLARLDQERPLDLRDLDLAAVTADAVADARTVAPDRTISFDVGDGITVVRADDDRIRQVLANVLGNALVHTAPGTAIDVTVRPHGDAVSVAVHDHGEGMPAEVADRATERFFRADPARSRHQGGSGLGLAIVASTVDAHGGRLVVDSAPGDGTTVTMRLPLEPPEIG